MMLPQPAEKPDAVLEHETSFMPLYRVLLHNDDVNSMDHVVTTLIRVFRFSREKSEGIMLEAHNKGVALCAREPYEQAEHHRDQLRSFSLISTIEPD
ncbi:MAG TPA: ATP-dependent Clp protease adaptor ClpS [Nitrospirota bacterium]|nr:ATP-dependent Clp protease adaptor ClpS [Nitrospirota bacterium]